MNINSNNDIIKDIENIKKDLSGFINKINALNDGYLSLFTEKDKEGNRKQYNNEKNKFFYYRNKIYLNYGIFFPYKNIVTNNWERYVIEKKNFINTEKTPINNLKDEDITDEIIKNALIKTNDFRKNIIDEMHSIEMDEKTIDLNAKNNYLIEYLNNLEKKIDIDDIENNNQTTSSQKDNQNNNVVSINNNNVIILNNEEIMKKSMEITDNLEIKIYKMYKRNKLNEENKKKIDELTKISEQISDINSSIDNNNKIINQSKKDLLLYNSAINHDELNDNLTTEIEKGKVGNTQLNSDLIVLKASQEKLKNEINNNNEKLQFNDIINDLKIFKYLNHLNEPSQDTKIQENSVQEIQEIEELENITIDYYKKIFEQYLLFFIEILKKYETDEIDENKNKLIEKFKNFIKYDYNEMIKFLSSNVNQRNVNFYENLLNKIEPIDKDIIINIETFIRLSKITDIKIEKKNPKTEGGKRKRKTHKTRKNKKPKNTKRKHTKKYKN